jgi:tRNA nucleotidyltransferase (CCA-adding enzyme)
VIDWIPAELAALFEREPLLARSYLAGGCVRDHELGLPVTDFDVEVYGTDYAALAHALAAHGRTDLVGRSFGVVKLTLPSRNSYDFTLPRRDSKIAAGHKGFEIAVDPAMTPRDAAARRDFTLNALMVEPRTGELLDFFNGRADLRARVLRHTSGAFADDPLRVLRGMQFCARFELAAAPETLALCRSIRHTFAELPAERVCGEWLKWAEKGAAPSRGLAFLQSSGWLEHFDALAGLDAPAFERTSRALDRYAGDRSAGRSAPGAFALLLDLADEPAAERFCASIGLSNDATRRTLALHRSRARAADEPTDVHVRRLAVALEPESIDAFARIAAAREAAADPAHGRAQRLLERARVLGVARASPEALVLGRHLLERGLAPGKQLGELVREAYDAQLDGAFSDAAGARAWLDARVATARSSAAPPPDSRPAS